MRRSLHIDICAHIGQPVATLSHAGGLRSSLTLRHAERQYYRSGSDSAIVQEFDGRYGYLYCYELHLAESIHIPVRVEMGDLHVLYLMEGSGNIALLDTSGQTTTDLAPQRGRYLYLPPGDYILDIPCGFSQLFGFYFDGGIFRAGSERAYRFLQPVLTVYRERSPRPAHSIDFEVGPRTRLHIEHLCANLCKGDFNNERFLLNALHGLITLSREKVLDEHEQIDPTYHLAYRTHRLIEEQCARYGQEFSLDQLSEQLGKSPQCLHRAHKQHYGLGLQAYKQQLVIDMAKERLTKQETVSATAYQCGFGSVAHFCRYFKRHTGITPGDFRTRSQTPSS